MTLACSGHLKLGEFKRKSQYIFVGWFMGEINAQNLSTALRWCSENTTPFKLVAHCSITYISMHTRRMLDNDSYMSRGANKCARSAVRSLKCTADPVKEKHNPLLVEEYLKTRTRSLFGVRSIYSNGVAGGCKQRHMISKANTSYFFCHASINIMTEMFKTECLFFTTEGNIASRNKACFHRAETEQ